ncbi:unnamed protein product, partial [Polarella glacialis]
TNDTFYHDHILPNETYFLSHTQFWLSAAGLNWRFPSRPKYFDLQRFNLTTMFNLGSWNQTILDGNMFFCRPPPPATTPPMLSASKDGWNSPGAALMATTGSARTTVAGLGPLCILLWSLCYTLI